MADAIFEAVHRPPQPSDHRLYGLIRLMAYLGMAAHTTFIPLFLWLDVPFLATFNVFSVGCWAWSWRLNRRGRHDEAIIVMGLEAVVHAVLAVGFLGWGSGFAYYLIAVVPATMFIDRLRTTTVLLIAMVLCLVFMALYVYASHGEFGVPGPVLRLINYGNIAVVFAAIGIMTYYFRRGSDAAERRLAELAGTDPLTRLPNRRRLGEVLDAERLRGERGGRPFAVVLMDIDHFKRINDTLGHDAGDFVLRNVARVLRDTLREQDHVGRWGGEEFLAVLPESSVEQGRLAAERLREAVERARLEVEATRVPVTLTLGVALCAGGAPVDPVIRAADEALYEGKGAGRNRVICAAAAEPAADA